MRRLLLKIHLYLGLTGGLFLIVLGLTGSVIAFEADIPHWLNPGLFYVQPGQGRLPEQELIRRVEAQFAPARVGSAQVLRQPNLARIMQLPDRVAVFVNPYNGSILGSVQGGLVSERVLGYIHQVHLRLLPDPRTAPKLSAAGKTVVSVAGLILCFLVPTGLILFWRTRRTTVKWSASWFRICFDVHHVVGVYASVFLFVAALTGILIGFDFGERIIFSLTRSEHPAPPHPVHSVPMEGGVPIPVDRAIEIAHGVIPGASLDGYLLPRNPKDTITILLRVPEETSGSAHSSVTVDQFSGNVLRVQNFLTDSRGYRWVRFNRCHSYGRYLGHTLASSGIAFEPAAGGYGDHGAGDLVEKTGGLRRVRIIHQRPEEAAALIRQVQNCGCLAEYCEDPRGPAITRAIQQSIPDVVVIDLSRLPSHGREIGVWLRGRKATRHVPLIFVDGEPEKVARVQEALPDAAYTDFAGLPEALRSARAKATPVVPPQIMDRYQGRTAAQKMNIRPGMKVALRDAPRDYAAVLGAMPEGAEMLESPETACGVTIWFVHEPPVFLEALSEMRALASQTKLWVLWRKGSRNGITQNFIRENAIEAGLVDYKICAVDGRWSGIAFARKKA